MQSDGKIVLVTQSDVYRLTSAGALDTSFGTNGEISTGNFLDSVTVLSGGSIIAVGNDNDDIIALKYSSSGVPDNSFGSSGMATIDASGSSDEAFAVVEQSDGKVVIGGIAGSDLVVLRLNSDGSLDSDFASSGVYTGGSGTVHALHITGGGKILAVGTGGGSAFVTCLNSDGSLDTGFGSSGILNIDASGANDTAYGIVPSGSNYVVAIEGKDHSAHTARFSASGVLDSGYGSGGVVSYANDFLKAARGIGINSDGSRIYMASDDTFDFVLAGITTGVVSANNPPVITEGDSVSVEMDEDSNPTPFSLTLHATDTDGDTLTWSIGVSADHGTAGVAGNASGDTATVSFTPETDYYGDDSFTIVVSDGSDTDSITVNVTINEQPETGGNPEVAVSVGGSNVADGGTATAAAIENGVTGQVTVTIANSGNASLSVSSPAVSGQSNCTASIATVPAASVAAGGSTDAVLDITPTAASGTWSVGFSFTCNDSDEANYDITITGDITATNTDPTIDSAAAITPDPVTIPNAASATVSASDADGDTLTYTWSKVSGPGTATFTPNGTSAASSTSVSFNADGNYTLRVTVDDGNGGTATSDVTITVNPDPNAGNGRIEVLGNGVEIADGDNTPDTADNTDFGAAYEDGGTVVKTFTISNTGTASLSLTGTELVAISGADAADFTVTTEPAASIAAGGWTPFQVTFDPSSPGSKTATVTIESDDSTLASYDFAIAGEGLEGAEPALPPADDGDDDGCNIGFGAANVWAILFVLLTTIASRFQMRRKN